MGGSKNFSDKLKKDYSYLATEKSQDQAQNFIISRNNGDDYERRRKYQKRYQV